MKKIVRIGTFETNSSSTHSISIGTNKPFVYDMLYPDKDGNIFLLPSDFYNLNNEKYNDTFTKVTYLVTMCKYDLFDKKKLINVIKKQTGCKKVIICSSDIIQTSVLENGNLGRLNHCSDEELTNFLFNKNSWLFLYNDNKINPSDFTYIPVFKEDGSIAPSNFYCSLKVDKDDLKFNINSTTEFDNDSLNTIIEEYGLVFNYTLNKFERKGEYWEDNGKDGCVYFKNSWKYVEQDINSNYFVFVNEKLINEEIEKNGLYGADYKTILNFVNSLITLTGFEKYAAYLPFSLNYEFNE